MWNIYFEKVIELINKVKESEGSKIEEASKIIYDSITSNGLIYIFGTGHSHILAEEMFYRAGGLAPIYPILISSLMLHESASCSTELERLPDLAEIILGRYDISSKDVMIIISNSGVNAVPVEAAIFSKKKGAKVIAITSIGHSSLVSPRNPENKRLFEIADITIDNHVPYGDAIVELKNTKVSPVSTVIGAAILNSIVAQVSYLFEKNDKEPPVFVSANLQDRGDIENYSLLKTYKKRIPIL